MLFNSTGFLIFLPIVVLGYYIIPEKGKKMWLLLASYFFYMCWNAKYALLILTSTVVTYFCGVFLEKVKTMDIAEDEKIKRKKLVMVISLVINLGILAYFKYTNFFLSLADGVFNAFHINLNVPTFDIMLPVGISFYTFQAVGYTVDVYRDDIYAEKNFITYALFVSFFPQLVAGPIERSKNLIKQLSVSHKFNYEYFTEGILLMIWGFFCKLVLADRVAVYLDNVLFNYNTFPGTYVFIAVLLVNIQVYCDFYGYSLIATGAAKMLGVHLMENFDAPLLSRTITELWRRWHISLTSWFTDYLYKPLGGSRKGIVRKYLNIMVIFLASGLWHGASLNYVAWGFVNGLYQIISALTMPIRKKILAFLHIDSKLYGYQILQVIVTYLMFGFSAIPPRMNSFWDSMNAMKTIFTVYNPWILFDGSLYNAGIDQKSFTVLLLSLLVLFVADMFKYRKIYISKQILKQDWWFRSLVIVIGVTAVLLFGIWGPAFEATNFIYFQF